MLDPWHISQLFFFSIDYHFFFLTVGNSWTGYRKVWLRLFIDNGRCREGCSILFCYAVIHCDGRSTCPGFSHLYFISILLHRQFFHFYKRRLLGNVFWYPFSLSYNQPACINHRSFPVPLLDYFQVHTQKQVLDWFLKKSKKWPCRAGSVKLWHEHTVKVQ